MGEGDCNKLSPWLFIGKSLLGKRSLSSYYGACYVHSILAWRIPWTEELGRLQFMESQRVRLTEQLSLIYLWSQDMTSPPAGLPNLLGFLFINFSPQFSHLVMSDSLRPHELQHARPPCPSPSPGVYSNSCPLSQ